MTEGRYFYRRGVGYLLEASKSWGIGIELCHFEDNASLHIRPFFGNLFIRLPKRLWRELPVGELMVSWGFSWNWSKGSCGRHLHLHWGERTKIIHMPWDWVHVRHDVLMKDGTWKRVAKGRWDDTGDDGCPWNWPDKFQETWPYEYRLRSGEVQNGQATIGVEEREWRWRWFQWLSFPCKVERCIDVTFDNEVGERVGSWKGGCTGCGYQMQKGEAPVMTLKRMERERKFT